MSFECGLQVVHILPADMTFVGSWMNRDALGAKVDELERGRDDIGIIFPARISESREFVDVD